MYASLEHIRLRRQAALVLVLALSLIIGILAVAGGITGHNLAGLDKTATTLVHEPGSVAD